MLIEGGADVAGVAEMDAYKERYAELLRTAEVDVVAYGYTVGGMLHGLDDDAEREENLSSIAHAPVVSTSAASNRAATALGLETISIATPYADESNTLEREHFEELGYTVAAIEAVGIEQPSNLDKRMPVDTYEIAQRAVAPTLVTTH